MKYRQLNAEERRVLAALRTVGLNNAEIGREMGRHRSTIGRELKRNCAPYDGGYRCERAHQRGHARRYRSRRNSQFTAVHWQQIEVLLQEEWSPEQVAGHLSQTGQLEISHETIYRYVWRDLKAGGTLHRHLRGARKQCRKRYGHYDSRGRLAGKRMIGERPKVVERALRHRALGDRYRDGRKPRPKQRLHSDLGRTQDRLRTHREAGGTDGRRSQPRAA